MNCYSPFLIRGGDGNHGAYGGAATAGLFCSNSLEGFTNAISFRAVLGD